MALRLRLVVVCSALLLAHAPAVAQPAVAPAPHLALDELVKEYKRLGLPLPPPNAELVRLHLPRIWGGTWGDLDVLGFRIPPTKPGEEPTYLVGSDYTSLVSSAKPVKPNSDALKGVRPEYVSDLLCLAVQCRERGWNEFATLLYARARVAIQSPVPEQLGPGVLAGSPIRVNGWELRAENSSVLKELRLTAEAYWHPQVMDCDSDRREVHRYLKVLYPDGHDDIRDLERTLAPRKSKPGSVEALIDDLTDWTPDRWTTSGKSERGRAAYWKLVELGFDAVPALLEHIEDERLTRYEHGTVNLKTTIMSSSRVRVRDVVGQLLNDLSGRELREVFNEAGPQSVEAGKARAWWETARKEGEEKWLLAHATLGLRQANKVLFRVLGTKYPARLGEFYRTVLNKHPRSESRVLADEIAASKLPRVEKLSLLVEGAEHSQLDNRLAALTVLAKLDPPLFRKHLLATLQKLPPGVETRRAHSYAKFAYQQVELTSLVGQTDDPACWDALAALAKQSNVYVRVEIIEFFSWDSPNKDKPTRRELLRFLPQFLSDESRPQYFDGAGEEVLGLSACEVATKVLAGELGFKTKFYVYRSPMSRLFLWAAVQQAAAEELARLKK